MAELRGGGAGWWKPEKDAPGTKTRVRFLGIELDVPPGNPMYKAQDVLTLEKDGETVKVGCKTSLSRIFRANKLPQGQLLDITYEGQKKGKAPLPFHAFKVETVEEEGGFPFGANTPAAPEAANEEAELERRLAAARARRAA